MLYEPPCGVVFFLGELQLKPQTVWKLKPRYNVMHLVDKKQISIVGQDVGNLGWYQMIYRLIDNSYKNSRLLALMLNYIEFKNSDTIV